MSGTAAAQGFVTLLDRVHRTGEAYTAAGKMIVLAAGSHQECVERSVDFVYQPIENPDGTVSGIFVQGMDMTERGWLERTGVAQPTVAQAAGVGVAPQARADNPEAPG